MSAISEINLGKLQNTKIFEDRRKRLDATERPRLRFLEVFNSAAQKRDLLGHKLIKQNPADCAAGFVWFGIILPQG